MEVQVCTTLHIVAATTAYIRHDGAAAPGFVRGERCALVFSESTATVPAVVPAELVAEFLAGYVDKSCSVRAAARRAAEPFAALTNNTQAAYAAAAARKNVADVVSIGRHADGGKSLLVLAGQGAVVRPKEWICIGVEENSQQRCLYQLEAQSKIAFVRHICQIDIFCQCGIHQLFGAAVVL